MVELKDFETTGFFPKASREVRFNTPLNLIGLIMLTLVNWSRRSCQPRRRVDRLPQSRQTLDPTAAAEISHWLPSCLASKMRMPCPRDQIDFLSARPSYGLPPNRSRARQKMRRNLYHGAFDSAKMASDIRLGNDTNLQNPCI